MSKLNNPFAEEWSNPFEAIELEKPTAYWSVYKERGFISLEEAVLLSLDVSPDFYFSGLMTQEQFGAFKVLKATEYQLRLKSAMAWIDGGELRAVVKGDKTLVDLVEFVKVALARTKWIFPDEFLLIAGKAPTIKKQAKEKGARADWIIKGRVYAKEYMDTFKGKSERYTQAKVAEAVLAKLIENKIEKTTGGYPEKSTIAPDCLRKDGWWKKHDFQNN